MPEPLVMSHRGGNGYVRRHRPVRDCCRASIRPCAALHLLDLGQTSRAAGVRSRQYARWSRWTWESLSQLGLSAA
jgi:hypothetical protein